LERKIMKNATHVATSFHGKTLSSRRFQPRLVLLAAVVLLLLRLAQNSAFAGSATWRMNPFDGDWNRADNWTAGGPPNGPSDTATFASSNQTSVSLFDNTLVEGIVFNSGASAFTITVTFRLGLSFDGAGITNNSGITQKFVLGGASHNLDFGEIYFDNSATAGTGTAFTLMGGDDRGRVYFYSNSSAGSGTFTLRGPSATSGTYSSFIGFSGTSTAASGTFTVDGSGLASSYGAVVAFYDASTAANGSFTINGGTASSAYGGYIDFVTNSTAGNATVIANGGINGGLGSSISFRDDSLGGTARIELFENGFLDISGHHAPGITVGSIEGDGHILLSTRILGSRNLRVGSNNSNTVFSGLISDRGSGGSLTKIGTGKLVLSHRNTYTGGTIVSRGKLIVNNIGGSGTGSGPVQVDGGWLGGKGIIAGAVTVGTGSGSGAVLAPGYVHGLGSPGALTIQSPLTFNVGATYNVDVNSSNATADEVVANGVSINSGAQFSFADLESGILTPGTVFTVINNTAATPIVGTFSNLPDGSIFTANGNTYQVSYQGGDGNDLTLTVVP
jgi:autotransporter-associated beta strand protein